MPQKYETRVIYRCSITGRIVTEEYARKHPNTTERQHVRVPVN